jgi:chorismate synthase
MSGSAIGGTPIALFIRNEDQRSEDYDKIAFRPGHTDYMYLKKYGIRDPRGAGDRRRGSRPGGGSEGSGEEMAARALKVTMRGCLSQLGPNKIEFKNWDDVDANPFFVADGARVPELERYMDGLRKSGDSCGSRINLVAIGVPPGWVGPLYGRLDGDRSQVMSTRGTAWRSGRDSGRWSRWGPSIPTR